MKPAAVTWDDLRRERDRHRRRAALSGDAGASALALEPLASKRDRPRLRMAVAADMTLLSFAGTMRCPKRNRRRLRAALRAEVEQSASAVPALAGRLRRYWAMRITNETVLVGVGLDVGDMGPSSSVVALLRLCHSVAAEERALARF